MNRLISVIAAILLRSFSLQGQVSNSELRVADTPKRFIKETRGTPDIARLPPKRLLTRSYQNT